MSAFIIDIRTLAQISEFINILNFKGYDFMFSMPEELRKALNIANRTTDHEKKIFAKLYDLNVRAVNGRYSSDEPTAAPEYPNITPSYRFPSYIEVSNNESYHDWIVKIEPWHYQMIKSLQCLIYQCEEDATINDPLFIGLEALQRELAYYIVSNQPEYNKAIWG